MLPTVPPGTVVHNNPREDRFLDKAAVFVDGGFFGKVLDDLGKPRIDFEKLSDNLCADNKRLRTYYYDCLPYQGDPPTPEERERYSKKSRWLDKLLLLPRFEVRLGKLSPRFEQKGVDILFSVDLVRMSWAKQIDRAILITGDSDFIPAVNAAKETGIIVELYYYISPHENGPSTHQELIRAVDERYMINQDLIDRSLLTA
jgi:uncharacterized LabA/DUF88 family protein